MGLLIHSVSLRSRPKRYLKPKERSRRNEDSKAVGSDWAVVVLAAAGCDIEHDQVPTPPEGTLTVEEFVAEFNRNMRENRFRIRDWVENGKVFKLRLPDIIVGDSTLTYKAGNWFSESTQAVFIECSFRKTQQVRPISNHDTVDIVGSTVEAEQTSGRIVLRLRDCQVEEVSLASR